jgi:CRP-like cAMP-binding protein
MGCGSSKTQADGNNLQAKDAEKTQQAKDKKMAKDENKEFQTKMQFLQQVPLMKRLPKDQHPLVATVCLAQSFNARETVIKQGDPGSEFFVIRSGEAAVWVKGDDGNKKKIVTLKAGDYFGEAALLKEEARSADIIAETALQTFKITRADFQKLGLNDKLQFANRRAVGGGAQGATKAKEPSKKTKEEFDLIAQALRSNENLETMTTLDDARVKSFIDVMWKEEVGVGQEVITEGDLNADFFYVVQSGTFEVYVSESVDQETGEIKGEQKLESTISKGGSFGELALLYFVPRAATIKAKTAAVVWVIDRKNFKEMLMKVSDTKIKDYMKYLDGVQILTSLLAEEKKEVAKALVEMHFTKGELVIQQGERGNTFYILYEGKVDILKDGNTETSLEASVQRGMAKCFGEGALLDNELRTATVKVTSETAKTLVLDRDAFNLLLGPLKDIIEKNRTAGAKRASCVGTRPSLQMPAAAGGGTADSKPREKILRKDLTRIGLLGCGGFGTVELYENKKNGETYAMKGLSKGYIVKTGMQDSVMNEKNILMMTNSPFIIKLWETYNGAQSLYFLLEPALGGELYATYNRKSFHGSEKHAKYYVAGTTFAFEHLHERRVIYRDLKPENLLLTAKGHIKLTDMGLAKFVIGKTYTTCGTPDYFAPELIASTGHTNAVDWWTLGILIFELMSGHPPFESAYPMQIYAKVTKGISKVPFPAKCQGPVGDLIRSLLRNEPSERLPMRPGSVQNLKAHKWFEGFDWTSMSELSLEAPYKPVVKSPKDLANFSARKEDMPRQIEYVDPGTGWDKQFATA